MPADTPIVDQNASGGAPPAQPVVSPAPQPAPVSDAAPAPSITEAKPVETAPLAEAKPADIKPAADAKPGETALKLHTDEPSLLEQTKPKADAKPGEKPTEAKPGEAKPGETKPVVAEAPKYEFKLPDGVVPDAAQLGKYTEVLSKYKITPEVGQELLDLYSAQVQRHLTTTLEEQHRVFGETRKGWRNEIMADPALGGAGHQTAAAQVARMRDLFVPEAETKAFNDFLRVTGAGDHPAFWRLLHRVAQRFDEPAPAPQPNGAPRDRGRPQNNGAGRRSVIYDHPSSQRNQT